MKLFSFSATLLKTFRHGVYPPKVNPYNVMIRGFAWESKKVWEAASERLLKSTATEEVLCEVNRKRLARDFNNLISDICQDVNEGDRALKLYDEMRVKGFSPNESTFTSLIHSCFHLLQCDKAYSLISEMIDSGFSPSLATYNALVGAYCRQNMVEEALGILRAMPERSLSPDVVTYNTLISCFCQMEELDKAFEMKVEMVDKGILPDAVTYKTLILALCSQGGSLQEAFDLFREMLRGGMSPDKPTYFSLMNLYCLYDSEFSKAFHMHDEMVHKGFLPDFVAGFSPSLVVYNAFIYGLCFLQRADEALGILRGMTEMGLSPDSVTYSTVISGFCNIGEPGNGYKLKVEMDKKGIWWLDQETYESLMENLSDEDTYSSLMNDYFAEGNMEKVYKLDRDMTRDGYLSSSIIEGVFINGLNKEATTKYAKICLLDTILNKSLTIPSHIIYDTLVENSSNEEFKIQVGFVNDFSKRGLTFEAAKVHEKMFDEHSKSDGAVYNLLIFEHCRCRNVHKAYDMYKEMVHCGFAPHMFSVLALIKALYNDGRYNEMSCVIQNTLRSCNLNVSEVLNKIDISKCKIHALLDVLAEIAMDRLLLDGGESSYACGLTSSPLYSHCRYRLLGSDHKSQLK